MPTPEMPAGDPQSADDPLQGSSASAVRGMPVDAGTIEMAAVETGPEVRRRATKGLGFAAWLSIAWIVLVVGLAILAPCAADRRPEGASPPTSPAAVPLADAGTAPGHLLGGDFNGRDMLSRLIWGGRTTLVDRDARRRSSASSSAGRSVWSAATSAARSTSS